MVICRSNRGMPFSAWKLTANAETLGLNSATFCLPADHFRHTPWQSSVKQNTAFLARLSKSFWARSEPWPSYIVHSHRILCVTNLFFSFCTQIRPYIRGRSPTSMECPPLKTKTSVEFWTSGLQPPNVGWQPISDKLCWMPSKSAPCLSSSNCHSMLPASGDPTSHQPTLFCR